VYKLKEAPGINGVIDDCMNDPKTQIDPEGWLKLYESMPKLKEALEADYVPSLVRFKSFRSCGQQLSKLQNNLDRLRLRADKGEDVTAEIESRKKQVKKMRRAGIFPSPGLSVFGQIDLDKSGSISKPELERLLKAMSKVFPVGQEEVDKMWKTLDSDGSGTISEAEWMDNLRACAALRAALVKDLDPDSGRLRSYRGPEAQLAKLLGNIQRLEFDLAKGKKVEEELESRKAQAKKWREKGIFPSPGVVVFFQLDKKKKRRIDLAQLKELLEKVGVGTSAQDIMTKLDADKNGFCDEHEWLENLEKCHGLVDALKKDMDPDTGKLKSYQ